MPYTNSYKKSHDLNSSIIVAETSVEELNLMESETYDDTTCKEGDENSQD